MTKEETISFYDTISGKEIHVFDIDSLSIESPISANEEPEHFFKCGLSVHQRMVLKNPNNLTVVLDTSIPAGMVQARKHKRKRINKKWLKRYGEKMGHKKIRIKATEFAIKNNPGCYEVTFKGGTKLK